MTQAVDAGRTAAPITRAAPCQAAAPVTQAARPSRRLSRRSRRHGRVAGAASRSFRRSRTTVVRPSCTVGRGRPTRRSSAPPRRSWRRSFRRWPRSPHPSSTTAADDRRSDRSGRSRETVPAVVGQVARPSRRSFDGVAESSRRSVEDVRRRSSTAATPVPAAVGKRSPGRPRRRAVTSSRASARRTVSAGTGARAAPTTGAESAATSSDDSAPASGTSVRVAAGGALPARSPLVGVGAEMSLAPSLRCPEPTQPLHGLRPATATAPWLPWSHLPAVARPPPTTSVASAPTAAPAAPSGLRPFGFVVLGGLLAVGLALISTSSAGSGGHSPSSTTAATVPWYRLVVPALRWRVRALAERVRPAPIVFPIELPG